MKIEKRRWKVANKKMNPRDLWKKMVSAMESGHKKKNRGVGHSSSIPKPRKY